MGDDWEDFFEDNVVAIVATVVSIVILISLCCCCCLFFAIRNRQKQPIYTSESPPQPKKEEILTWSWLLSAPVVVAAQSYQPNDGRGGPYPINVHTSEHLMNQSQAPVHQQVLVQPVETIRPPRTLTPTQGGESAYSSISSSSTQQTDVAAPSQAAFRSFTTISRQTELDDLNPPSYEKALKSAS